MAPPTATATATPTPLPTVDPQTIAAEFGVQLSSGQTGQLGCTALVDRRDAYPPRIERTCPGRIDVAVPADGIVVGLGTGTATRNLPGSFDPAGAPATEPHWAWTDLDAMGGYVVIDHGPRAGHGNVTSITWDVTIADDLIVGSRVTAGTTIGSAADGEPVHWQLWTGENVFGTPDPSTNFFDFETAMAIANGLSPLMAAPVAAPCSVNFAAPSDLPNAGRPYRSGTHRGVDLICGSPGHPAFAALDSTVVAVVNDYQDSPVQPRLDALNNAALGGGTPHWTLNLLFGNFVVLEHIDPDGREVLTISAHMEQVEPEITVGQKIKAGALLGEVGNRGTGPSAAGTTQDWDRSRHLHWEIFVDGAYLAAGLDTAQTASVYRSLLCGAATMNGC